MLSLVACGDSESDKITKREPQKKTALKTPIKPKLTLFEAYLNKIPTIKLPVNLQCEKEPRASRFGLKRSSIDEFGVKDARITGKIAETNDFVAIIYLYPGEIDLPILKTTDKKGNKISQLKLYDKWCGDDEFSWGTSWTEITKNRTIILSDSVVQFERYEQGGIIEQTRTTEVRHRVYRIDSNGKIRKKSEKKETV